MRWLVRLSVLLIAVLLLAVALTVAGNDVPLEIVNALLLGWARYLGRTLPAVRIERAGLLTAAVCLLLFTAGAHGFLRWLSRQLRGGLPEARSWSRRATLALSGLVVMMFVAGLSVVGVVHEAGWLARSPEPWLDYRLTFAPDAAWPSHLRQSGLGVVQFANTKGVYSGAIAAEDGHLRHSWMTLISPYLPFSTEGIRWDEDWDSPANAPQFRRFVPYYLNPAIGTIRSPDGFALSHLAGSSGLLGGRGGLPPEAITDGSSQTLIIGEVASAFRPWGDPYSWRDAGKGLNRAADGFGNPDGTGASFVFADGSVRFLRNEIDPAVLRALSTPAGGEPIAPGVLDDPPPP